MYVLASVLSFAIQLSAAIIKRQGVAYYDPNANGGSMLDNAGDGLGEPLNVIVSGLSTPDVLTDDGIVNYARAIGFSEECFDIHLGGPQSANLGDGNSWVNQTYELRQDYDSSSIGTCLESLIGGNHFRVYRQNGTQADSGALFLAVSKEEDVSDGHDIVPDGYNIGRNDLVSNAVGQTSFGGVSYTTTAQNVTGLLAPGAVGVNHNISVDGIVTVLTVTIN
ncbi:hypothetical protein CONPUDRAFT_88997 [Coniophora puteana RWD-64-598 SS2]|uniref:Uncharacterized protein n=1 Tax=Coniophora puteana (strain RWD-64-598) TaxID=741705 RepID=A0A5M3MVF9_CONPW|nr:uncharacterized protein CONPUDRAFT_88997 [Coniophora puteana RWD-64-598 SS2]EIW82997.1 hypothetical protein CONPUDRAFT_88997 [Coniophora puteana RWD-64-598 SS2]